MIPKIIHYCWLSDDPIPSKLQNYINGWKKLMPDYQFKKWAFDIHSVKWVEQAYENRKWAFAADYIRAYALYTEGGIYLDSDVEIKKSLTPLLDSGFISSIECNPKRWKQVARQTDEMGRRLDYIERVDGIGIQAAIIGAVPHHPFLKKILDYYDNHLFFNGKTFDQLPAPYVYAELLENEGLVYQDQMQLLNNDITLFRSNVFADYQSCDLHSYAIHMCSGSWVDSKSKYATRFIKNNLLLRKLLNTIMYFITSKSVR